MGMKNDYLPTRYWIADNKLYRAFYEYEEYPEHIRDSCDNLGIIVNFSDYNICGHNDEEVYRQNIENWLLYHVNINEDWYESHRNYGIDGLLNKFKKDKCAAFQFISVYDHSGISVRCGKAFGWDYSNVGFIYVPKDSKELNATFKNPNSKKAKEWAERIIQDEIKVLNDYCQGSVYCLVSESYNTEIKEWNREESFCGIYLTSDTWKEKQKLSEDYIKYNMSGSSHFVDEKVVIKSIENNSIDTLLGQKLLIEA